MSRVAKAIVKNRKTQAIRAFRMAVLYLNGTKNNCESVSTIMVERELNRTQAVRHLANLHLSRVVKYLMPTLLGMCRVGFIHRKFEAIFLAQDSASHSNAKKLAGLKPCFISQVSAVIDAIGKTFESLVPQSISDIKYPKMLFEKNIQDTYLVSYFVRFASNEYRYLIFPRQRKINCVKAVEHVKTDMVVSAFSTVLELELYKSTIGQLLNVLYSTFEVEDINMYGKHYLGDKSFKGYSKAKSQGYEMIAKIHSVIRDIMKDSIGKYRHVMLIVLRDFLLSFEPVDIKIAKNKWRNVK